MAPTFELNKDKLRFHTCINTIKIIKNRKIKKITQIRKTVQKEEGKSSHGENRHGFAEHQECAQARRQINAPGVQGRHDRA